MPRQIVGLRGPKIGTLGSEIELNDYPPRIIPTFEEDIEERKVVDGSIRAISKGFIFTCILDFTENRLCSTRQYEKLRSISNLLTTLNFIPYPVDYPNSNFTVRVINGLKLEPYRGRHLEGYQGTIELRGLTILEIIPPYV